MLLLLALPIAGAEHLATICGDGERSFTPRYTEVLLLSWFLPVVASMASGGAESPLQIARSWRSREGTEDLLSAAAAPPRGLPSGPWLQPWPNQILPMGMRRKLFLIW